jgi:hypothetical protein
MHKPVKLALAATAVATAAATVGVGTASAAPTVSHAPTGTEYIQVMSASTGPGTASVIARGVFTAAGQVRLGDAKAVTITFPGGTVVLTHKQAHGSQHFSPASCLSLISQSGSYRITRGTGRYAGISGHGTYQLSLEIIGARAHGQCSPGRPPLAQQELLRLSGPIER